MMLSDAPAERAILAGVCRYGSEAYYDVADLIDVNSFTIDSNCMIYSCLKHVMDKDDNVSIDLPVILSAAKEIGLHDLVSNREEVQHLSAIMNFPVLMGNVRKMAAKVRKLQIARMMYEQLESTKEKYSHVKGDEPVSQILGIAEESIFDFTSLLTDNDDAPKKVFSDVEDRLDELSSNPLDQVGIPTGFGRYDFAIGGGLRKGTVNVIGARPKTGKTLFAENAGIYMAHKLGIPVLNLDTEMMRKDHQDRGIAMLTEVAINDIETGRFASNSYKNQKIRDTAEKVKDIPYYHKSIGGKPFEDQLSIMRRWLAKEVGLNAQGKANDCVIVYDYLKIMESSEIKGDLKEYQLLGFLMTSLHNFAIRYEVPVLAFVQLNRDGINKESTDTASGSDRIIWLCSNFSIYKSKSDEEIAKDGPENGNRKLVPVISRHGEGLSDKDYININMIGKYGKIVEGKTAFELEDGADYSETLKMIMTTSHSHDSYKYNDQAKLNALTATAVQYIDKIYEYMNTEIEYRNDTFIKSRCFIHGGDNPTALNLYPNGDIRVHYKCRTHECEEIFGSSLISLIRGGLSRLRYGWNVKGDKEASFNETVEFILEFTRQDFNSLSSRSSTLDGDKLRFSSLVSGFTMPSQQKEGVKREFYRSKVEIPSQYYLQRGYSIEVLDKYDVGTCKRPKKSLYQRAVVPVYDDNGDIIVGFTGRSIFDECSQCKHYHDPKKECHFFPKWKHTAGFQKENCLYNYWYAKEHILKSGVVVLVESPGNVWRLEEAGIHNAVAIFGAHLGPNQKKLIDSSGAFSIVCLLDNDEAGVKGAKKIYEQCSKMYRLYFPKFNANDIGDMNVDNVTNDIKPLITQLGEVYNG